MLRACWLWSGATTDGYGVVSLGGKLYRVHRVVYEEMVGPISAGHDVHHTCHVRHCYNPLHLEPISHTAHGRESSPYTDASHCVRGHAFTEENTYVTREGKRRCRTCKRDHEYQRTGGRGARRGPYRRRSAQ